ncbi:helix-turn-helix domain-containing protein [Secundilactobacillus similis]|uniref:Uncharacterized protein n=1 Tax=Secundilactobacillus similis DSM 23365 = JCM 2765 TaxID=1423804 RepID=A0A0R2EYG2_9LACO|nr:helix-turn-helix transcriptional regulator [Secundilactobacillus similis]KRN20678.1 hypothetical protein FD14_GL001470 [Secundilactobacillus similis DSM 23365 = JCM 2765]
MKEVKPLDQYLKAIGTTRNEFASKNGISPSTLQSIVSRDTKAKSFTLDLSSKLAQAGGMYIDDFKRVMTKYENGEDVDLAKDSVEGVRSFRFGELFGLLQHSAELLNKDGHNKRLTDFVSYMRHEIENFDRRPGQYLMKFVLRATRDFPEYPYFELQQQVIDAIDVAGMTDSPLTPIWLTGMASVNKVLDAYDSGSKEPLKEHTGQIITLEKVTKANEGK